LQTDDIEYKVRDVAVEEEADDDSPKLVLVPQTWVVFVLQFENGTIPG
jgi:hypothetical protein